MEYFLFMSFSLQSHRSGRIAGFLFLALLACGQRALAGTRRLPRVSQRPSSFLRAILRLSAGQLFGGGCKDKKISRVVPAARARRERAVDGAWMGSGPRLQDLRREHMVGEFLVVAPDGWDTFYINSRDGKTPYSDFFLREFIPFIEHTYRVRTERAARGITGFSMGGYGALRMAFAHPELFGSVSAHSGALMRAPPHGVSAGRVVGESGGASCSQMCSAIRSTRNSGT